jgi:hypothetical protein
MELYCVTTITREYRGCKNVTFQWFRSEPGTTRRPYGELITDYDPRDEHRGYAEGAIDELFTADEAAELAAYLDREHGNHAVTTITKADPPIRNDVMGVGAIPVGGGDDFYMLCEKPGYSLRYKVWGYYDLVGCELIDGSDVYRERLWIINRTGAMREESNEEAAARERRA